ncbi:hypothetical protein LQV63_05850, partial [Paenibacillus profundus]
MTADNGELLNTKHIWKLNRHRILHSPSRSGAHVGSAYTALLPLQVHATFSVLKSSLFEHEAYLEAESTSNLAFTFE